MHVLPTSVIPSVCFITDPLVLGEKMKILCVHVEDTKLEVSAYQPSGGGRRTEKRRTHNTSFAMSPSRYPG